MKELKYLNLLYTEEIIIDSYAIEYLESHFNKIFVASSNLEVLNICNSNSVDIVITNNDFNFINELREKKPSMHIIISSKTKPDLNDLHECINHELIKYIDEPITEELIEKTLKDFVKNIDSNKSNVISLQNNFVYDKYNTTLIKNKKLISLTNKENSFLKYMVDNENKDVSYDELNNTIWEGSMTNDALRSVVKELRKKTYKELIKNVSGIGYRINLVA